MKTYIIHNAAIVFVFLLSACHSNNSIDPIDEFETKETLSISQQIEIESYGIYKPGPILKYDSLYIINEMTSNNIVKAFNRYTHKVYKGIHEGNGPGEILFSSNLLLNNNVPVLYDAGRKISYELLFQESDSSISIKEYKRFLGEERLMIINYAGENTIGSGFF